MLPCYIYFNVLLALTVLHLHVSTDWSKWKGATLYASIIWTTSSNKQRFFSSSRVEMKWRPVLDFSHLVHTAQVNSRPETYGPHGKFPPHVHFSQSAKKESTRNIFITIDLEKSERRHFCSLSTPRSRRWSYHDGKLNYYCNSLACFQLQRYAICMGNSMICSDIWHKYHKWYFEIVIRNFTSL